MARQAHSGFNMERTILVKDILKRFEVDNRRVPGVMDLYSQLVFALATRQVESGFRNGQAAICVKQAFASTNKVPERRLQIGRLGPHERMEFRRLYACQIEGLKHVFHQIRDGNRHRLCAEGLEVIAKALQQYLDVDAVDGLLVGECFSGNANCLSRKSSTEGLFLKVYLVCCHHARQTPERHDVLVQYETISLSSCIFGHGAE